MKYYLLFKITKNYFIIIIKNEFNNVMEPKWFYNKIIDLKFFINNEKPNIFCLQETNLKPNHSVKINNYSVSLKKDKLTQTVLVGE